MYNKPDVTAQRTGLGGSPILQGGAVIPAVVAQTLGKENLITDEQHTIPASPAARENTLNKATITSPVKRLVRVGNTVGASDYRIGATEDCIESSPDKIVWNSKNLEVPVLDQLEYTSGGTIPAGTHQYVVTALDQESVPAVGETTQSNTVSITTTAVGSIIIRWSHPYPQLVTGYKIYKFSGGSFKRLATVTGGSVFSYTDTTGVASGANPPGTNGAYRRPGRGDIYYVSYDYVTYDYTAKTYFSASTVEEEHGVGSNAANAAHLILDRGGNGNGAQQMVLVAPQGTTDSAYQEAIDKLKTMDVQYVALDKVSATLDIYLINHCIAMSEPNIKRFRRAVLSHIHAASVADIRTRLETLSPLASHRGIFIVSDGHPTVNQWRTVDGYANVSGLMTGTFTNPTQMTFVSSVPWPYATDFWAGAQVRVLSGTGAGQVRTVKSSDTSRNVYVTTAWTTPLDGTSLVRLDLPTSSISDYRVDGCWAAIAAMGRMCSLPDTATSMTEKVVNGISSVDSTRMLDTEKDYLAEVGGSVLENRGGVMYSRDDITLAIDTVENQQRCVVSAEDYSLRKSLIEGVKDFKGTKLTDDQLDSLRIRVKQILDGLVGLVLIREWFESSLVIQEDVLDPTYLKIYFDYTPVYPIRRIAFYYRFRRNV